VLLAQGRRSLRALAKWLSAGVAQRQLAAVHDGVIIC